MENIEKERHASWLENFYDLIVAIVVFQLSTNLNHDVSIFGFLGFVALFIPVWWSWIGVMFYNSRFETDDLGHRLLTLLQMAAAAFMAVNVPDGLGKNSAGFGAPRKRTPFGASMPSFSKISGCLNGNSIISLTFWISSFKPPISSYATCVVSSLNATAV